MIGGLTLRGDRHAARASAARASAARETAPVVSESAPARSRNIFVEIGCPCGTAAMIAWAVREAAIGDVISVFHADDPPPPGSGRSGDSGRPGAMGGHLDEAQRETAMRRAACDSDVLVVCGLRHCPARGNLPHLLLGLDCPVVVVNDRDAYLADSSSPVLSLLDHHSAATVFKALQLPVPAVRILPGDRPAVPAMR